MKPRTNEAAPRTSRAAPQQVEEALRQLDSAKGRSDRRGHPRFRFRQENVVLTMHRPNQPDISFRVFANDISRKGLGCLHSGFVHEGTSCTVAVRRLDGRSDAIHGRIVNCRYVQANLHGVGIEFEHEINPALYSTLAVVRRVLLADDDPFLSRLVTLQLGRLNASVDHASNGREAVEKAMAKVYDIILMDDDMPELTGFDAVAILRGHGFVGPIAAFTTFNSPEEQRRLLSAGFDYCAPKPHSVEDLGRLISLLASEPLYSTADEDPEMAKFVEEFVKELPAQIRTLEKALASEDPMALARIAERLRVAATACGFLPIAELAANLQTCMRRDASTVEIQSLAMQVIKCCRRARWREESGEEPAIQGKE